MTPRCGACFFVRLATWAAIATTLLPGAAGMVAAASENVTAGAWRQENATLAWTMDGRTVWRFSYDEKAGKPFFDPLTVGGGTSLTNFKPEDHPWHYGLWFSWKYINGANYWEENRTTGRAEGATSWSAPRITTHPDGSARIALDVTYTHPSGRVDVTEQRELRISAPAGDGSYAIDWQAHFTSGSAGAHFDRTPMPGEPDGRVNGGYAGLGVRLAGPPLTMSVVSVDGPVEVFADDRARPFTAAMACNFADGAGDRGGLAIFSDPVANGGFHEQAPWYIVRSAQMHFACAAVLAVRPVQLAAGESWHLHYRIALRGTAWTTEDLRDARN